MYKFLSLIVAALFLNACTSPAIAPTASALPIETLIVIETATVSAKIDAVDLTPTAPAIDTQPAPTATATAEAGIPEGWSTKIMEQSMARYAQDSTAPVSLQRALSFSQG